MFTLDADLDENTIDFLRFSKNWRQQIEYSNMTSFIGYINNTVKNLTIYFDSLMRIEQLQT